MTASQRHLVDPLLPRRPALWTDGSHRDRVTDGARPSARGLASGAERRGGQGQVHAGRGSGGLVTIRKEEQEVGGGCHNNAVGTRMLFSFSSGQEGPRRPVKTVIVWFPCSPPLRWAVPAA